MKSLRRMMLAVVTGACIAANGQMLQDIKGEQTGMSGSKKGPDVSLGIGVDGGWMTSRVYTPAGDYTWKGGVGFVAGKDFQLEILKRNVPTGIFDLV